jgi:hypothetical protein
MDLVSSAAFFYTAKAQAISTLGLVRRAGRGGRSAYLLVQHVLGIAFLSGTVLLLLLQLGYARRLRLEFLLVELLLIY